MNSPDTATKIALEQAKQELGVGLEEPWVSCTYDDLLVRLKREIDAECESAKLADPSNKVRHFARHRMGLISGQYRTVRSWLKRDATMTTNDMILVMNVLLGRTIQQAPKAAKTSAKPAAKPRSKKSAASAPDNRAAANVGSPVVDHVITSLNSLVSLVSNVPGLPATVNDSHRMSVTSALKRLTEKLAIEARFPQPSTTKSPEPLTAEDCQKFGLKPEKI
jgi:hypothetical protein